MMKLKKTMAEQAAQKVANYAKAAQILSATEQELQEKIELLRANYSAKLAELEAKAQEEFDAAHKFCEEHRSELLEAGKKSAAFPTGTISWRKKPDTLKILDEKRTIADLKELKFEYLIKAEEKVIKAALLQQKDIVDVLDGVHINYGDEVFEIKVGEKL